MIELRTLSQFPSYFRYSIVTIEDTNAKPSVLLSDYQRDGYAILRNFAPDDLCAEIRAVAQQLGASPTPPYEKEVDLGYPGAPTSETGVGGDSIRRLTQLYQRHPVFQRWVNYPPLVAALREILGEEICLTLAHHNSLMTKVPNYSSDTRWHQDLRYWHFSRGNLVTAWLALGDEYPENGGMRLIPGSHKLDLAVDKFDTAKFFDVEQTELRNSVVETHLSAGDVLLFHCKTLHAAAKNNTDKTKLSVVFTFRGSDDMPEPNTRSSSLEEIKVS